MLQTREGFRKIENFQFISQTKMYKDEDTLEDFTSSGFTLALRDKNGYVEICEIHSEKGAKLWFFHSGKNEQIVGFLNRLAAFLKGNPQLLRLFDFSFEGEQIRN